MPKKKRKKKSLDLQNSLYLQAILWQMNPQAFEVPTLMTFYLHNKSFNKLFHAHTTIKQDVQLYDLHCSALTILQTFIHPIAHPTFIYSHYFVFLQLQNGVGKTQIIKTNHL